MIKLSEILKGWKDYGGGTEHQIFTSDKNPNVIYKVGKKDTVLKWSDVFKSNPKIFPKVYKVGKLKDGRYYAEIEKLNTDKVVKDWGDLEQALELIGVVDTDVFEDTIDQAFINILSGHLDVGKVYTDLASNKKIQALFKKWIEFLSDATEYVENSGYNGLDIHRYNFAYDAKGNPKVIDI